MQDYQHKHLHKRKASSPWKKGAKNSILQHTSASKVWSSRSVRGQIWEGKNNRSIVEKVIQLHAARNPPVTSLSGVPNLLQHAVCPWIPHPFCGTHFGNLEPQQACVQTPGHLVAVLPAQCQETELRKKRVTQQSETLNYNHIYLDTYAVK